MDQVDFQNVVPKISSVKKLPEAGSFPVLSAANAPGAPVCFWQKADNRDTLNQCPLLGVKRTCPNVRCSPEADIVGSEACVRPPPTTRERDLWARDNQRLTKLETQWAQFGAQVAQAQRIQIRRALLQRHAAMIRTGTRSDLCRAARGNGRTQFCKADPLALSAIRATKKVAAAVVLRAHSRSPI